MENLPNFENANLLVGYDSSDDACVYRINDETAVIQTVDFFTPIVDDPYTFGQIAAANALSDVYAMGGTPVLAMNLLCVPNCLTPQTVREILRGGHDKAVEAGCVIAGGHSIQDNEPKYGLCVMGMVHPDRILKNIGALPGDVLILTKPLGCGILSTGVKAELVSDKDRDELYMHMATLNAKAAAEVVKTEEVHACTDITGFGLLGHAYEMASGSDVTIRLCGSSMPLMNGAMELALQGIIPGGAYRNMDYVKGSLHVDHDVPEEITDLAADPQTSGGLLISLPSARAGELMEHLLPVAACSRIVGEVVEKQKNSLELCMKL